MHLRQNTIPRSNRAYPGYTLAYPYRLASFKFTRHSRLVVTDQTTMTAATRSKADPKGQIGR